MAAYPTFNGGVRTQLPASYGRSFDTSKVDIDSGKRYAYYNRATALRRWELSYPVLTDSETATLKTFFEDRRGRYETFTFVDPYDGASYTNCRFGTDNLDMVHVGPNQQSVTVIIEQFVS